MTNASAKNTFAVLFIALLAAFASGALVTIAHAQDMGGGYLDYSGDNGGYIDTSGNNGGYLDYSGNNGGYIDTSGNNGGYIDTSGNNGGYIDTSGNNGGYIDTCDSSCYSDTGYSTNYSTDCGCQQADYTPAYTYQDYGYSSPLYDYSTPMMIFAPGYGGYGGGYGYSTPISAPPVQNVPVAYQQQQQQQQQAAPSVTTNTCVNYSCNTTTNISNSGNTTTTIIPVASAPVTYPVQYTFPPTYQNVSCNISASQNSVQSGQYTFLTWQSYGAASATLTNYGNVAPNGSLSIQPYGSVNYVLTVYGSNGQTATCNAYVTVGTAYPTVTLSQIPYTGFDLGSFGDAMYWALLMVFALAAGYLLVYYKGGMGAFAGTMIPARKAKAVSVAKIETKTAPAPVVEKKIETPVAPKARTLESLPTMTFVRPTSDSMTVATHGGAPRIVINRS